MKQLLLPVDLAAGELVAITGVPFHHLCRVRRAGAGDTFVARGRSGRAFTAVLESVSDDTGRARIVAPLTEDTPASTSGASVRLFVAPLKGRRTDGVIRQVTELGVTEVGVIHTERCVARVERGSWETRRRRWEAITREAVEQSGRTTLPRVLEPLEFHSMVEQYNGGVLLHERDGESSSPAGSNDITLAVGPEGGFADREIQSALEWGWTVVTLPLPVLRAETAAIVAGTLAMLTANQYSIGLPENRD